MQTIKNHLVFTDINFRQLAEDSYVDFLKCYVEAFPPEERRDYASADELRDFIRSHGDMFAIMASYSGDTPIGFLSYWRLPDYVYVEHAVIRPDYRCKGLGRRLFEALIATEGDKLLLEVEPEGSTPDATRRIGFYRRLGFNAHPEIDYLQPPYGPGLPSVPLLLMTHGHVNLSAPASALTPLFRHVYGASDHS